MATVAALAIVLLAALMIHPTALAAAVIPAALHAATGYRARRGREHEQRVAAAAR